MYLLIRTSPCKNRLIHITTDPAIYLCCELLRLTEVVDCTVDFIQCRFGMGKDQCEKQNVSICQYTHFTVPFHNELHLQVPEYHHRRIRPVPQQRR